ncbi:hypothetical protein CC1G_06412 [Coprinopsis cinerea okayama7|uniref:Uncharacterized protein n=1 Tax=Coprinopsis cinerea (strain Okayama-7 / 130 / ATCC MYA-4618 / FGSC 9003) TaxID=240176 RepID=A8NTX6_COPC7|nr:hypothetical protein CC1G_06412 [Coprinopsis cinerea okayama7\|eukprot:XP_001836327.1 hypothetical protein CC1G_06412 [Coprinopsis cinerea okayama7\
MVVVDLRRRQGIQASTAAGIENSAIVVDDSAPTGASGLAVDGSAPTGAFTEAIDLVFDGSSTPVAPPTPAPTPTPTPIEPAANEEVEQTGATIKPIPIGTVVGSCVGAFLGAALLVVIGLFFYKRYNRSLKQKTSRSFPRSPYKEHHDSRAHSNNWNRLDDKDEDRWEGKDGPAPTAVEQKSPQQNGFLAPLETMDMFAKSPSESSHRSDEPTFEMTSHPYSQTTPTKVPEPRDLLGRDPQYTLGEVNAGAPMSWASDSSKPSFLTTTTALEGGAMSPTLSMAIPTPPATKTHSHHFQSAEVVEAFETAPAVPEVKVHTSSNNPFFRGGNEYIQPSRARSQSQSSTKSNATVTQSNSNTEGFPDSLAPPTTTGKAKERVVSIDPFTDPLPPPSFIHHQATGSASSAASNERAIRQLMAATGMDLDEAEIQRRLKALSMQPSIISNSGDSMYTDAEPDEPTPTLPPSSSGHTTTR